MAKSSFVERNKAVREAWNKELELVQEGKGTREWTPEQQKDILEKGRAYDENGKAFEGQHMKSAEMYPEYQGDPGNIQFLTRAEHLEAHNGNWRNPTNWYYNPVTKEKFDFGDGPFIPCEVIHLPEPIMKPSITVEKKEETLTEPIEKVETEETPKIKPEAETRTIKPVSNPKLDIKQSGGFGNTVKKAFKAVVDFSNRHPVLTGIVKAVGVAGLAAAADAVANGGRSSSGDSSSGDYSYTPSRTGSDTFDDSYDEILTGDVDTDTSAERSSPKEHTVRPHGQHYIKNGERVWIEKEAYTRDEMREEHIITTDYRFIDKEGEYFAKLIMRAEASKKMLRLFFQLSDGRKIITPVFWWQSYLGFYEIDNGTNLRLIYEKNGKGIALKKIEILD